MAKCMVGLFSSVSLILSAEAWAETCGGGCKLAHTSLPRGAPGVNPVGGKGYFEAVAD